jgi:hypothetical protein
MSDDTLTMGPRAWEFLLSEAEGQRSRENGVLAEGQNLTAGTVLQLDGDGNLVAFTAALNTGGDIIDAAIGILGANVDATDADTPCAYIARDAEVKLPYLTWPAETTGGGQKQGMVDGLYALGIVISDEDSHLKPTA